VGPGWPLLGKLPSPLTGAATAIGCQVEFADRIAAHKAEYVLALKDNQPTIEGNFASFSRLLDMGRTIAMGNTVGLILHPPAT
jgi:hypothetical protein